MNLYTKDADGKIVKSDVMSLMSKMRAGVIGDEAEQSVSQSMNNMFSSSGMSSTQSQFVAIHDGARPLIRPEDVEA